MDGLRNFISGTRRDGASPPRLLKIRSSTSFILTTICLAVFTDIFLYAVIVPVIPFAIGARAGVPHSDVQRWVSVLLAVYGGALLVASPVAGWYADNSNSRRFPLLIGLLALAGATLMLCLAQTIWLLVLGRVLQGISAAIVWTVGTALLVDTVGKRYIGQTMGYVSISMSLGILIAPLLGGLVRICSPIFRLALTQSQGFQQSRILCSLLHGLWVNTARYSSAVGPSRKESCAAMDRAKPRSRHLVRRGSTLTRRG